MAPGGFFPPNMNRKDQGGQAMLVQGDRCFDPQPCELQGVYTPVARHWLACPERLGDEDRGSNRGG